MGATVVPAPTVGRNWSLLASSTTTGVSTLTFSSISAFNFYKVRISNIQNSPGDTLYLRFNNDSTTLNVYSYLQSNGTAANSIGSAASQGLQLSPAIAAFSGEFIIDNTGGYTTVKSEMTRSSGNNIFANNGLWLGNAQINRLDVYWGGANSITANNGVFIFGSN